LSVNFPLLKQIDKNAQLIKDIYFCNTKPNDMEFVDILGYVAGLLTTLTFLPQVIKTVKEKSAKDVSLNMFLIAAANQVLWVIYGVLKKDLVIIMTNVLILVLSLTMILLKLKFGRTTASSSGTL
jgi:MtN3 and saliva related transmembrane protein